MKVSCNLQRSYMFFKFLALFLLLSFLIKDLRTLFTEQKLEFVEDFEVFMSDWCRVRRTRSDVNTVLGSCRNKIKWDPQRVGVATDANKSFVSSWRLKPAGQFSRFFIQAVAGDGTLKSSGGDWWRVSILGTASMRPTVFDLGNGTYEVLFLVAEPGIYSVDIILDYTLCDGFRDPPDDWFIIGNAQGKMQPDGVLRGRAVSDYRLEPFQGGKEITIDIKLPNARGLHLFNILSKTFSLHLSKNLDFDCGVKCNLIWDGYGRWARERWKPYLKARNLGEKVMKSNDKEKQKPLYKTLWIYGDSQARRMFYEIQNTTLCRSIFENCKLSWNWVYAYTSEFPSQDDLDFDYRKITSDIKKVLKLPEMSENSVMVLNLGLHYLQSTNFSNYVKLLHAVVDLFKECKAEGRPVRMIWKTSTPLSKEKDLLEYVKSDGKRFLNNPRVAMFNAFATSLMCSEGFEVLDIHPLTVSYPYGTGGPNVEFYKEHDIVHFRHHVMVPFEKTLAEYLRGNLPKTLSIENYEFC